MEALVTASALSATPIDTLHHNKLFSSSTQFYEDHSAAIPSIKSLDPSAALDGLHALTNRVLPAFRPGRTFGRRTTPNSARQTRSPSPSLLPTKIQEREACTLQQLEQQFDSYHRQIFDGDFVAQSEAVQQTLLDEVNTWLEKGMITLRTLEEREQERRKKRASGASPSEPGTNRRNQMQERMRNLFAKICALYAPLIPTKPIEVDAGESRFDFIF